MAVSVYPYFIFSGEVCDVLTIEVNGYSFLSQKHGP